MRVNIELEWEQVDKVVTTELKSLYADMAASKRPSCGFRYEDEEADLEEMKKMRKALRRILTYYGEKV